jgi:AhpD family alkylhydroperoxidase
MDGGLKMEILDPKTKEFIGIAAAVAGLCQPCFDYHFGEAQKYGKARPISKASGQGQYG